MARGPSESILAYVRSLDEAQRPFLWVTDREPVPSPRAGRILRMTTLPGKGGTLDPKRLGDLRDVVATFVGDAGRGAVVLDCLEYLVAQNGVERVERALAALHDEVTMRGGSLVVFVDDRRANPRLVAWLERELDPLPSPPAAGPEAGILSA